VRWSNLLGLSLKAVPTEQRANLGLEDGLTGVLVTGVLAGTDAAQRGMTEGDVILRVQDRPVATAGDVQQAIGAQREAHRSYAMLLVLPKVRKVPGPQWVALRLSAPSG